jgi:DNA-binding response OmpR family regulator
MKILIADDELRLRKVVALHLKKAQYDVTEASNGRQAVKLAENNEFQCIVLDVMMPEMDGIEACGKIREKIGDSVPIIMLTAKADASDIDAGIEAGADAYLTKPFSPKELIEKIKGFVENGKTE